MGCYVDGAGNYYEGDKQGKDDLEVPQRQSQVDVWVNGAWTPDPILTAAKLRADAREALSVCTDVALRCSMAGIAFPPEWQTYAQKIKAIASGADTTSFVLPSPPPEPALAVLYQA